MAKLPEFFGLNLGHEAIKLVQLKEDGSHMKLVGAYKMPATPGMLDNDSEEGVSILSKEISKAVKSSGLNTKNCVISVPEVSVFSRLITLPELEEKDISDAINYALKPLVPIPIENVNVSFLEINRQEVDSRKMVNWYVVAAPKQLIARLQLVVEGAGLNLLAVETEALAIARMVQYNYSIMANTDCMLLDMGSDSTNLILSRNGVVIFSQNIGTGSDALTKVIAADFGIDLQMAEKYKIAYGLSKTQGEGKIFKSIEPIMQIMLSEVQRTIVYYSDKIGGSGISKIFLTGGGAHLIGLDKFITEKFSIQSEVVNPIKNIKVDPALAGTVQHMALNSLNVSIGLGLKGVL